MRYAKIIGTGSYLPDRIMTNSELEETLETNNAWIINRTGIYQRHIADSHETTAFMATQAAKQALAIADVSKVDMIIVATTTPDAFFPSTACFVQAALGLSSCPAFDISAACAGFNYALTIAEQFIRTHACQHVLVIGSEMMSRLVDWTDRNTCILFGDGAGAILLGADHSPGIIASQLYADGSHQHLLYANNIRQPDPNVIKMQGSAVFRQAVSKMGDALTQLLKDQHMSIDQVDWFIPHQANLNIIHSLAKKLSLPQERVIITIADHANTSSASVPLALDQAIRNKRIKPGQLLLIESFGGGITWGAALIKY